ncbi:MAG TPA: DUF3105 domain-containing protein [Candidatus Limnocylindria bacterium]|nr:DUF3105 domain-containing protein [Candidatus Limnocylindria bacterium]
MAKRRTTGIQRRERASAEAMSQRLDAPSAGLPDWRILAIGGVLLAGVILVILVLLFSSGPNANAGTTQPDDGTTHITDGATCRSDPASCGVEGNPYSSTPGTSGPHWNNPANWGVYATPQNESQVIHNLEHGGIIIWYDPEALDAAQVDELAQYVTRQVSAGISGRFKFMLSPWDGADPLDAPIVVTAWRNLLELDQVDLGAIDEFAREHYGRSPEPNGGPGPPSV